MLMDWWLQAQQDTLRLMGKGLASVTLLTTWMTWKHRNTCISDGAQPSISTLVAKIKVEANMWAKAGAKGLRVVLPES
jgi:nuclear pore complex protein Nup210